MVKTLAVSIMCLSALMSCQINGNSDKEDHSGKVRSMYWLEGSGDNVVEYIEENAAAQYVINSEDETEEKIYSIDDLDRPPLFRMVCVDSETPWECSKSEIRRYIIDHIEWPYDAERNMEEGTEVVHFILGPDGEIDRIVEIESENRYCTGCRQAAIHVIENMPRWLPGILNGQPVPVQITIPVKLEIVS